MSNIKTNVKSSTGETTLPQTKIRNENKEIIELFLTSSIYQVSH